MRVGELGQDFAQTLELADIAKLGSVQTPARRPIGTSGTYTFNPRLDNAFFLMVGENGIDEGSYGKDGAGVERPEDVGTAGCDRPQNLGGIVCE